MSFLPLVIFHKQLGDLLLMEPALHKWASSTGGPVRLSTREVFLPMVSLMEGVQGESCVRFSRAKSVLSFSPNVHAGIKAWTTFAGLKRLVVARGEHIRGWHGLVYRGGVSVSPITDLYQARYYYDAVPCNHAVEFRPPQLRRPPDAWRHAELPQRYLLIHPTSAWQSKSWPAASWTRVIESLWREGYGPFVLTGGPAEWERNFTQQIREQSGAPVFNLGGRSNLKQYLHAVANAEFVLSVDGSASHLAAAFQRPNVTLFGSTSAEIWHWKTDLSVALEPPMEKKALKGSVQFIPVETVLQTALSVLERFGTRISNGFPAPR